MQVLSDTKSDQQLNGDEHATVDNLNEIREKTIEIGLSKSSCSPSNIVNC